MPRTSDAEKPFYPLEKDLNNTGCTRDEQFDISHDPRYTQSKKWSVSEFDVQ